MNTFEQTSQRLLALREKLSQEVREAAKAAFQTPADIGAVPPGGGMPMDPAMMDPSMGGGMPVDPSALGGMPMDPAMMQGGMSMDPAMPDPAAMGGMAPTPGPAMDPSLGGTATDSAAAAGLTEQTIEAILNRVLDQRANGDGGQGGEKKKPAKINIDETLLRMEKMLLQLYGVLGLPITPDMVHPGDTDLEQPQTAPADEEQQLALSGAPMPEGQDPTIPPIGPMFSQGAGGGESTTKMSEEQQPASEAVFTPALQKTSSLIAALQKASSR